MSGHNKWSKIKHKKAAADAQKSKQFSKYASLITTEAKKAGGDRNSPSVRAVVDQAKAANMPNDNIERALAKALQGSTDQMDSVVYEAYGPGGVGIIIDALTDNRNRTAADIKHALSKHGIELAQPGSASWAFTTEADGSRVAHTTVPVSDSDKQKLDSVVESLEENEDVSHVYTNAA